MATGRLLSLKYEKEKREAHLKKRQESLGSKKAASKSWKRGTERTKKKLELRKKEAKVAKKVKIKPIKIPSLLGKKGAKEAKAYQERGRCPVGQVRNSEGFCVIEHPSKGKSKAKKRTGWYPGKNIKKVIKKVKLKRKLKKISKAAKKWPTAHS